MEYRVGKELLSEKELHDKVSELAEKIRTEYRGKELICVCVLKGAVVFLTDLIREIGPEVDIKIDFLAISSYGASTHSSGVVKIQKDLSADILGKNVLIVEDILDTGLSLAYLKKLLAGRHPASLEICVMFDKPDRRKMDVDVKYIGFEIPNDFVVGYGLDYAGKFRNLKSLHIAEPEE